MLSDVGCFFVAQFHSIDGTWLVCYEIFFLFSSLTSLCSFSPSSAVFCCVDPIFIDMVAAFSQIFSLVLNLFEEFVDVVFPSFSWSTN